MENSGEIQFPFPLQCKKTKTGFPSPRGATLY